MKGFNMKMAKQMMEKMEKMQEELEQQTIEGTAGGGMVKAIANGKQEIISITIDKEVVDPEDVEMLQDMIIAATNDALRKAKDLVAEGMQKVAGPLNIPGLDLGNLL